jgi:DNA-binding MarR family transcriptional regulator
MEPESGDNPTCTTSRQNLRKYRTEIPNLVDDAGLDPYEFRLLVHYKRVGRCTEGTLTTAKKCCMSTGTVSRVRQSLADKKWITLQRSAMGGNQFRYVVTVIDRWEENYNKYSSLSPRDTALSAGEDTVSPHDTVLSAGEDILSPNEKTLTPDENSFSPGETKNELIKNEPIKNQPIKNERDSAQNDFSRIWANLERLCGAVPTDTARLIDTWLEKHPPGRILQALDVTREKHARSPKYVDSILKGWETNGYPPTREQQVLAKAFKPAREKSLTTLLLESIKNGDDG